MTIQLYNSKTLQLYPVRNKPYTAILFLGFLLSSYDGLCFFRPSIFAVKRFRFISKVTDFLSKTVQPQGEGLLYRHYANI